MAGNIKGITIEFNGDTTKLSAALNKIKAETKGLDSALKKVNSALKFSPGNVELLTQKQSLLTQKINASKQSLDALKQAQAKLDASGVSKTSNEYMELRREIITTESKIKTFNAELLKVNAALTPLGMAGTKLTTLGTSATKLGNSLKGVSATAGVLAAGIGLLAYKAATAADDLNTLAAQYGISTKELQNYQSTADLVDVSVETLVKTHSKLKKSMLSASQSASGSAAKAFNALGISVQGTDGHLRDGNQVYDETIQKLAGMSNETERDAYAMAIFGKSAAELNPLLEGGAEKYAEFTELMRKNKLEPVSQEQLDEANRMNDAIDIIKATFDRAALIIGTKIAGYIAPKLESLSEKFVAVAGVIANMSGKTLSIIGGISAAVASIAPLLLIFGKLSTSIGGTLTSLSRLAMKIPLLGKVFGLIGNPIFIVIAALGALVAIMSKTGASAEQLQGLIANAIGGFADKLPGIIDTVVSVLYSLADALPEIIPVLVSGFLTLLQALVNALPDILPPLIYGFTALIVSLAEMMPTLIPTLIQAAITLFMGIVQAIPTIVMALLNALPQIVQAFYTGLANTLPAVWESIKNVAVGKFTIMVNRIGEVFKSVVEKIVAPFKQAQEKIQSIIDAIKNIVNNVKLKLDLKLPHISLDGGKAPWGIAGKGKLPSFDVNWYANGGIFDSPSIIGVGEAGTEVVTPLDKLQKMLDNNGNTEQTALLQQMVILMGQMIAAQKMPNELTVNKREFGRIVKEVI